MSNYNFPTPELSWQYSPNNVIAAETTTDLQAKACILKFISILTSFPLNPWTVAGSSNGTTAGMDGVNRIAAKADIVCATAGSAHSWIALRQPATGIQIVLDWVTASSSFQATRVLSVSAGFTGGSTTNRPTATDENNVTPTTLIFPDLIGRRWMHAWHSTDGTFTMMIVVSANHVTAMFFCGNAASPVTGWAHPGILYFVAIHASTYTTLPDDAVDHSQDTFGKFAWVGGRGVSSMLMYGAVEGCAGPAGTFRQLTDRSGFGLHETYGGGYLMLPIGLWSDTASNIGRHGHIPDLWRTSDGVPNGSIFRDATNQSAQQFVAFGSYVFPWPKDVVPYVV